MDAALSQLINSIAASFPGAVIVFNPDRRVVFSRNLDKILGYKDADIVGRSLNEFVSIELLTKLQKAIASSSHSSIDTELKDANGDRACVSFSVQEAIAEDATVYAIVYLTRESCEARVRTNTGIIHHAKRKVKKWMLALAGAVSIALTQLAPHVPLLRDLLKDFRPAVEAVTNSDPMFDKSRSELEKKYRDRINGLIGELSNGAIGVGLFWFDIADQDFHVGYIQSFGGEQIFVKLKNDRLSMLRDLESIEALRNLKELDCVRIREIAIDSHGNAIDGLFCPVANNQGKMRDAIAAFYPQSRFPIVQTDGQADPDAGVLYQTGLIWRSIAR